LYDEPEMSLRIGEDRWLQQKPFWIIQFNIARVCVDATNGHVFEGDPLDWEYTGYHIYKLQVAETIVTPKRLPLPRTPLERARVGFGLNELSGPETLTDPPVIRDNSVFLLAAYFAGFMIEVGDAGETVTLQGRLKNKGRKATLKVGDRRAMIDGRRVELSAAPARIDGRLYLPYELLNKVNGIPVRWEAKKKMLWVDTRFLRR
jgi:hypothetical protein